MIRYCTYVIMFLFFIQTAAAQTETCIKGDCKGGFGVLRIGSGNSFGYYIGNFTRKGKLEGKAVIMSWSNANLNNEVDFLFTLSSQNIPPVEKLLDFKPSFIKSGNFVNGKLEGPGEMLMNNSSYFPMSQWIPEKWFKNKGLKYVKYEGDFIQSNEQKAGVVTFFYDNDTLICASDNLFQNSGNESLQYLYQTEMVIDIRYKDGRDNQLIRSNFINRKQHGWALVHRRGSGQKNGKFYRQLWSYGQLLFEDDGGAYPFDMDNPQTITSASGEIITGPLVNGKVNGFGTITYKGHIDGYRLSINPNNQYRGYIKDNLPDGYGLMDTTGVEKYGLFSKGWLQQGNRVTYDAGNRMQITELQADQNNNELVKERDYNSLFYYLQGNGPYFGIEGYKIAGKGWHGLVKSFTLSTQNEMWYDNGKLSASSSSINNIMVWQVYVKDGIASMVVSYNPATGEGILSDGRKINNSNISEFKPSKYTSSHFYDVCPCGGDAKTTMTAEVSGYTNTWSRTEQVNKSAVVGYWQGTQQVTSTYYTPGYTITRKVACSNPNAEWVPYGVGTRHSVLRVKSLKE
ncbi:MAG: hypothetical protein U0V75_08185 [Ferruginibacter sp.]